MMTLYNYKCGQEPFINISMPKVDKDYSLYRTYVLFRTLGLRHLVVVNVHNHVVGIITRKDLLPFMMQDRLEALLQQTTAGDMPLALQRQSTDSVEPPPGYFVRRPTDDKSADSISLPSVGRKSSANNRKTLDGVEETDEETDCITSSSPAETEAARDPHRKHSQSVGDSRLQDSVAGVQIVVSAPPQKNDKQDWV